MEEFACRFGSFRWGRHFHKVEQIGQNHRPATRIQYRRLRVAWNAGERNKASTRAPMVIGGARRTRIQTE